MSALFVFTMLHTIGLMGDAVRLRGVDDKQDGVAIPPRGGWQEMVAWRQKATHGATGAIYIEWTGECVREDGELIYLTSPPEKGSIWSCEKACSDLRACTAFQFDIRGTCYIFKSPLVCKGAGKPGHTICAVKTTTVKANTTCNPYPFLPPTTTTTKTTTPTTTTITQTTTETTTTTPTTTTTTTTITQTTTETTTTTPTTSTTTTTKTTTVTTTNAPTTTTTTTTVPLWHLGSRGESCTYVCGVLGLGCDLDAHAGLGASSNRQAIVQGMGVTCYNGYDAMGGPDPFFPADYKGECMFNGNASSCSGAHGHTRRFCACKQVTNATWTATMASYVMGTRGTNACPQGSLDITDPAECMQAAHRLSKTYSQSRDFNSQFPKGCYLYDGNDPVYAQRIDHLYFNTDGTGGTNSGATPVCMEQA